MKVIFRVILLLTISLLPLSSFAADNSNSAPATWQQLGLMKGFPPSADKIVTKTNFRSPPYNRWAFQHMRYVNFSAPIERGTGGVTPFEVQPQDILSKPFKINKQTRSLLSFVQESYTDSLLIVYKGKIVTEYYADGMTEQTPHWLASVTKSFTGTLADLMIHRGLLDPKKKVSFYIPELQKSAYGDATVQQVLDMEVGVTSEGDYNDSRVPGTYSNKIGKAVGFLPSCDDTNMYQILTEAKSIDTHGKKFRYVSPDTEVAGWLLSKVANKPVEVLLSEEIWSKLGSSGEAYTIVEPAAKMFSAGGMNVTTRDLARFAQMIANHGQYNNQQVLPPEVIQRISSGGNQETWKNGEFTEMRPYVNSYHSYWYQADDKNHAIMAMGVHGQDVYIDSVNNIVIVKFASYPTKYVDPFDDGWNEVFPQIAQTLMNS